MNTNNAVILQAIRGPILLITVGVLFALHQNGNLRFEQSCPILLIVFGILKLAERLARPTPPGLPPEGYQS